jgi:hypothetical protein
LSSTLKIFSSNPQTIFEFLPEEEENGEKKSTLFLQKYNFIVRKIIKTCKHKYFKCKEILTHSKIYLEKKAIEIRLKSASDFFFRCAKKIYFVQKIRDY